MHAWDPFYQLIYHDLEYHCLATKLIIKPFSRIKVVGWEYTGRTRSLDMELARDYFMCSQANRKKGE